MASIIGNLLPGEQLAATAVAIKRAGIGTVGLLGTRYTMELDFYRARLEKEHGLKVLVPDAPEREVVHGIIYEELGRGTIREESRRDYAAVIEDLKRRGAPRASFWVAPRSRSSLKRRTARCPSSTRRPSTPRRQWISL